MLCPPMKGETAIAIMSGRANRPIKTGNRSGPNSANGTVPRAIEPMPLPAPYNAIVMATSGKPASNIAAATATRTTEATIVQMEL